MINKHTILRRSFSVIIAVMAFCSLIVLKSDNSYAEVKNVTLKNGAYESYGVNNYSTKVRWVTHINGEPIDLSDEPGVSRSYAYCVQPSKDTPDPGTYSVTVIDDEDTGKLEQMRKMIYYLPGAYGYTAVTKARWFTTKTEGSSDYAIGHIALSYLYDNCSGSSDAWIGCGTKIKDKVKGMIADLSNLADPPESFEVFWVKIDGKQDSFGAIYATEYGKACVHKLSSNTVITNDNDCYTLAGAQYTVFKDSACTNVAKTKNGGNAVITIAADGNSDTIEIETGSYYIKETSAPRGYALDTGVHSLQISRDTTTTYTAHDTPKSNPLGILIQKVDAETGLAKPQAAASLKGAEFTIKYYDITPNSSMSETDLRNLIAGKELGKIKGQNCEWVFRTDKNGVIDFSKPDDYMIKECSAEQFQDSSGRIVLPIGIITIEETKAPKGYKANEEVFVRAIYETGTVETINTLKTLTDSNAVKEQVYRSDITFSKSSDGLKRMKYVPFKITSMTTGESHIVVTDENGYANTASSWNKHDKNTNAGLTDEDGIWFNGYNDEGTGAKAINRLAALPYDTYKIEELRCESNKGHNLIKDTITIKRDAVIIDMGTFDNKPEIVIPPSPDPEPAPEPVTPVIIKTVKKHIASPKTGDGNANWKLYLIISILAIALSILLTILSKGGRLKKKEKYICKH